MDTNTQRPEKPTTSREENPSLEVHSIWNTIQGEGPFAGVPAVFVRLAGCNIQCPFCDTDYTSKRELLRGTEILELVRSKRGTPEVSMGQRTLVVITGGEPFRQPLSKLVQCLVEQNYRVQIETNGTLSDSDLLMWMLQNNCWDNWLVSIVCSPKGPHIYPGLMQHLRALKYVVSANEVNPRDGLPSYTLGRGNQVARPDSWFHGDIYVQPMDEGDPAKNEKHTQEAISSCLRFGYRLCLQTHKMVGLE